LPGRRPGGACVRLLAGLQSTADASGGGGDPDARFVAEQNAAVAAGAERYYRTMVAGRRDRIAHRAIGVVYRPDHEKRGTTCRASSAAATTRSSTATAPPP
jgi:hypothetical protein